MYLGTKVAQMVTPELLFAMFDGEDYRSTPSYSDGYGAVPSYTVGSRFVRYAHNLGTNVLMGDGHAEYWKAILPYEGPNGKGSTSKREHKTNGVRWYAC